MLRILVRPADRRVGVEARDVELTPRGGGGKARVLQAGEHQPREAEQLHRAAGVPAEALEEAREEGRGGEGPRGAEVRQAEQRADLERRPRPVIFGDVTSKL